jgi:hypothetical protein
MGRATLKAIITSTMPTSMVVGMLISGLDVALDLQLAHQAVQDPGQQMTLSASVSPAE